MGGAAALRARTDVIVDGLGQADDARLQLPPPQLLVDRLAAALRAVTADGVDLDERRGEAEDP